MLNVQICCCTFKNDFIKTLYWLVILSFHVHKPENHSIICVFFKNVKLFFRDFLKNGKKSVAGITVLRRKIKTQGTCFALIWPLFAPLG